MSEQPFLIADGPWVRVKDGDDSVRSMFDRHYSRQKYRDGRSPLIFVGPGEKMVLMTPDALAIFVWRKFIDDCIDERTNERQAGVNCAVFRNEGTQRSSDLIRAADNLAWNEWPSLRLYTYVAPDKVRHKRDPGRCFLKAGYRYCGWTKSGKRVLEKMRPEAPVG